MIIIFCPSNYDHHHVMVDVIISYPISHEYVVILMAFQYTNFDERVPSK